MRSYEFRQKRFGTEMGFYTALGKGLTLSRDLIVYVVYLVTKETVEYDSVRRNWEYFSRASTFESVFRRINKCQRKSHSITKWICCYVRPCATKSIPLRTTSFSSCFAMNIFFLWLFQVKNKLLLICIHFVVYILWPVPNEPPPFIAGVVRVLPKLLEKRDERR